jgi:hypothetical protein
MKAFFNRHPFLFCGGLYIAQLMLVGACAEETVPLKSAADIPYECVVDTPVACLWRDD